MRPSTFIELAGFAAVTYAVYRVNTTAGIAVAGVILLLIAYATEDDTAPVSLVRMVAPARIRWERLKAWGSARRSARVERRERRGPFRRSPSEVLLRVKAD